MRHGKGVFVTGEGSRMPRAEKERIVRDMARHLAVEASQLGIGGEDVLRLVREELRRIGERMPAKEVGR